MTKNQALEQASTSAVKNECPYVVAHDPKEGQFIFGALKAINLTHPGIRASNYDTLCMPDGKQIEL